VELADLAAAAEVGAVLDVDPLVPGGEVASREPQDVPDEAPHVDALLRQLNAADVELRQQNHVSDHVLQLRQALPPDLPHVRVVAFFSR